MGAITCIHIAITNLHMVLLMEIFSSLSCKLHCKLKLSYKKSILKDSYILFIVVIC